SPRSPAAGSRSAAGCAGARPRSPARRRAPARRPRAAAGPSPSPRSTPPMFVNVGSLYYSDDPPSTGRQQFRQRSRPSGELAGPRGGRLDELLSGAAARGVDRTVEDDSRGAVDRDRTAVEGSHGAVSATDDAGQPDLPAHERGVGRAAAVLGDDRGGH